MLPNSEGRFNRLYMLCRSCVGIISSYRSGMGKSLYITALAEKLKNENPECDLITIPLHGPVVTPDIVLELFKDHFEKPTCCIYHIDIAPNVGCAILADY